MDENDFQKTEEPLADAGEGTECLYLWDSSDANSMILHGQMQQILHDMKVSYAEADIDSEEIPDCSLYRTVIIGTSDYTRFRDEVERISEWVMDGGRMMIAQVPAIEPVTNWLFQKAGVQSIGATLYQMPGMRMVDDVVLHGTKEDYLLEEPFESSLAVSLDEVCAWPVINGAVWYLDDFPSPVPSGISTYIERDYNMDIATFYTQVWWKNISELAENTRSVIQVW